jgi:hypothetical protein
MQKSDCGKKDDAFDKDKKVPPGGTGKRPKVNYGKLTADALNRAFPPEKKADNT